MKWFLIIFAGVILLGSAAIYGMKGASPGFSALTGGILMYANVLILAFVLKALFQKKSVAWMTLVVVSKYAILGFLIYEIATRNLVLISYFALGMGSLFVSVLLYTLVFYKSNGEELS